MVTFPVIPAKGGIYSPRGAYAVPELDSRFRGNDDVGVVPFIFVPMTA